MNTHKLLNIKNSKVGFDIDYTLTKDEGYYKDYINNYLNKKNLKYNYIKNTKNLNYMYDWSTSDYIDFNKNELVNLMKNLPVNENAKKIIEHLKNNNCDIYIITGRKENKRKITEEWLKNNKINYNKIVFGDKYKLESCKELKIDYFFDDNSKVVDLLNKNNIKAYLINELR